MPEDERQRLKLAQFAYHSDDRLERATAVLTIIAPYIEDAVESPVWPALMRWADAYTDGLIDRIAAEFELRPKQVQS